MGNPLDVGNPDIRAAVQRAVDAMRSESPVGGQPIEIPVCPVHRVGMAVSALGGYVCMLCMLQSPALPSVGAVRGPSGATPAVLAPPEPSLVAHCRYPLGAWQAAGREKGERRESH